MPDGLQDEAYNFTFRATDPDNSATELSWSDDSPLFAINGSGGILFTPLNADVGYSSFNITVSDPWGLTDTEMFTLFIANVNDKPVMHEVPPLSALEDTVWTFDLSKYVEDPDLLLPPEFRDRLTYRDDTPKLATNLETGVVTWDMPTNEDVGEFRFKVTVQDSKGRYAEQEIKITVLNTNDPPRLGSIPKQVLHQAAQFVYTVPATDPDLSVPYACEELTFRNDRTELFTIDPATGRISMTPENNQVGVWEVNITVTDAAGASATTNVVFEVMNKNDHPEMEFIPIQQLTVDVPYELQVKASDVDMEPRLVDGLPVDPSERLEYRSNSTVVPIDRYTGLVSFTPDSDVANLGDFVVKFTVIDRSSEAMNCEVPYTFTVVNHPPTDVRILGLVDGLTVFVGASYPLTCSVVDIDDESTELSYGWHAGTDFLGSSSTVTWTPLETGPTVVKLTVVDPHGGQARGSVSILVRLPNAAPYDVGIEGLADGQSVRTDTDYAANGSAKDDFDAMDALVYEWHLDGDVLSRDRQLVWRPVGEGPCTLSLEVIDTDGARNGTSLTLDIERIPPPPVIVSPPPEETIDKGEPLEVIIDIPEEELDPARVYTINVSSNVSGLLITSSPVDELELDLGKLPVGRHLITVSISDGTNEASTRFNVSVVEPPKKVGSPAAGVAFVITGLLLAMAVRSRWGPPHRRASL